MFVYLARQTRRTALATLGATLATGTVAIAHAAPPAVSTPAIAPVAPTASASPTIDAAAQNTLAQINAAYQGLNAFSATLNSSVQQGTDPAQSVHADIAFAKPNKASVIVAHGDHTTTIVSDGTSIFLTGSAAPTTYEKADANSGSVAIADVLESSRASATEILPLMIVRPDAGMLLLKTATSVRRLPDETLDGVPVDVISVDAPGKQVKTVTLTFAAGKDDHLLRRTVLTIGSQGKVTETYTDVKANPALAATIFSFTPKAGMQEVGPPPLFDPRLIVGAAPLPFAGTDLGGARQTLAAYKGKVVLLDFWATWCEPCKAEMPNIIANYDKYHAKGFEVVGVSLNQPNTRKELTDFIKANQMPWPQIYEGKDFESTLAKAYGVTAIPFSLLIGKDGKIAAVSPRAEELEPAIQAALAK